MKSQPQERIWMGKIANWNWNELENTKSLSKKLNKAWNFSCKFQMDKWYEIKILRKNEKKKKILPKNINKAKKRWKEKSFKKIKQKAKKGKKKSLKM